jgi:hypothetical protein
MRWMKWVGLVLAVYLVIVIPLDYFWPAVLVAQPKEITIHRNDAYHYVKLTINNGLKMDELRVENIPQFLSYHTKAIDVERGVASGIVYSYSLLVTFISAPNALPGTYKVRFVQPGTELRLTPWSSPKDLSAEVDVTILP